MLAIAEALNLEDGMQTELFFFHTPPTLLFFHPLGWFDVDTAFLVWNIILSIVLLICIVFYGKDFGMSQALLAGSIKGYFETNLSHMNGVFRYDNF